MKMGPGRKCRSISLPSCCRRLLLAAGEWERGVISRALRTAHFVACLDQRSDFVVPVRKEISVRKKRELLFGQLCHFFRLVPRRCSWQNTSSWGQHPLQGLRTKSLLISGMDCQQWSRSAGSTIAHVADALRCDRLSGASLGGEADFIICRPLPEFCGGGSADRNFSAARQGWP